MSKIDPTAIIDPSVKLGNDITIGAYSVIGRDVEIGDRCEIGPHVVLSGPMKMGTENIVYQFASVGAAPQDKTYKGEDTLLIIGDRNTIRECATINRGTIKGGGETRIGNDNLLMAYIHVAHDCQIGNNIIFSNNASLAGHVIVDDHAILSGFTLVHQFCQIGTHAFSAMGSAINRDVLPYVLVSGNVAEPHGINSEGLKRRGFTPEAIQAIKRAYKTIYRSGLSLHNARNELAKLEIPEITAMVEFLDRSERGIVR